MSFNLSEWALKNRALVLYAMLLLGAMGAISYANLGQSEDPPFTFKLMTIYSGPVPARKKSPGRLPSESKRN